MLLEKLQFGFKRKYRDISMNSNEKNTFFGETAILVTFVQVSCRCFYSRIARCAEESLSKFILIVTISQ